VTTKDPEGARCGYLQGLLEVEIIVYLVKGVGPWVQVSHLDISEFRYRSRGIFKAP
jgi:hypothetical protein